MISEEKLRTQLIQSEINQQETKMNNLSELLSRDLSTIQFFLNKITIEDLNKNSTDDSLRKKMEKCFEEINQFSNIYAIAIIDKNGVIKLNYGEGRFMEETEGKDVSDFPFVKNTIISKKPNYSDLQIGIDGTTPRILISNPILVSGEYAWQVTIVTNAIEFFNFYSNVADVDETYLTVLGEDSRVIVHPNEELIGRYTHGEKSKIEDRVLIEFFSKLFSGKSVTGTYMVNDLERLGVGSPVLIKDKIEYFIVLSTPTYGIFKNDILLEETEFDVIVIVFLTGTMIMFVIVIEKQRKREKDQQLLTTVGQISSKMAHDIRNPLSIIRFSLDNLKNLYEVDDEKLKQINKIDKSINRITHQIDGVLDYIKKQPLTLNNHKISEIISEATEIIVIPEKIILKLPKNDTELNCDKNKLAIALSNLILNGIQAVNGDGAIEITLEEKTESVILQVKDSGKGISKENMSKLWTPMFTTKQQGTGLGLVSVKSIIDAHSGKISVTSPPTVFTIILPKTIL